jgi:hypothetical protein
MRDRRARLRLAAVAAGLVTAAALAACTPIAAPPPAPPTAFTGLGFDTCAAPSTGQMGAWLNSPYRAIGVYIGGGNRGCSQPNLTAGWVSTVVAWGWRLAPLYVGLQAPCSGIGALINPADASREGTIAADDAALHAYLLGLGAGTPIYFDMEAYNNTDPVCSAAVVNFVNGWDYKLHLYGLRAGFYSSAASGIADQIRMVSVPGYVVPDAIWFAHWNSVPSVWGDPYVPDYLWAFHQRLHQYTGGHDENYAGVTLNIDGDALDSPTDI